VIRRALLLVLGLWLLSAVYIVRVDEQGVVRRFGAVVEEHVPPGLHLGFPWGIDAVDRVKVREQKRLSIGFELPDQILGRPVNPARREYFTGDQNLVNIELLLQYTVREPRAYLFHAADLTGTLRASAEAAVVEAVAVEPVDRLLTTGRLEVQERLRNATQDAADRSGLGLSINAVSIQTVAPPLTVAAAFRDVASAREDRDRLVKEAESYANSTVPQAEGEAARMKEEAIGYRDDRIRRARGDADRFVQAYAAYHRSPDVTRARLYLESMEQILPRMKVISVDRTGKNPIDLNLLPRSQEGSTPAGNRPADNANPGAPANAPAPASP
jgi:membrane protease subunit HflK